MALRLEYTRVEFPVIQTEVVELPEVDLELSGAALVRCCARTLNGRVTPGQASPPADAHGFGFVPEVWPSAPLSQEPESAPVAALLEAQAREHELDATIQRTLRDLVVRSFGVEPAPRQAQACLFADWLMHADEAHLSTALDEAEQALSAARTPFELD